MLVDVSINISILYHVTEFENSFECGFVVICDFCRHKTLLEPGIQTQMKNFKGFRHPIKLCLSGFMENAWKMLPGVCNNSAAHPEYAESLLQCF